ncbi:hypothetical protein ACS0TY_035140 [Phlomoides rotata]
MGRVEATAEIGTPNPGQHVGSYPQNPQIMQSPYMGGPWDSGLFDCHLDQTNAVMTALLPCVTFGQIAEVLDATEPSPGSLLTCPFGSLLYMLSMTLCANGLIGSTYRKKLRNRYGLVEAPYGDMMSHLFCPCCSLCQEFRELKKRDLDPALGWKGIVARQQSMQYKNEQINTPPRAQAMFK